MLHEPRGSMGRCDATGKFKYGDRKQAKRVAKRLDRTLRVYPCAACKHFHMGHLFGRSRQWHRDIHREAS